MPHFTVTEWLAAIIGAVSIGVSKAGFSGFGLLYVLMFAWLFGARGSTGVALPLLIFGDLFAVRTFHAHARWHYIRRMLPPACVGVVLAAGLMSHLDDATYKPIMGWIILALVGRHLLLAARPQWFGAMPHSAAFAWGMGLASGAMTMMANAAGPVFALYALTVGLPKFELVGTSAWFFFIINVFKVPFSYALGLIQLPTLMLNILLIPPVLLGVATGRWLTHIVPQGMFNTLLLIFAAVAALRLVGLI